MSLRYGSQEPISYPENNGTGHFSYRLETAQLPFGVHITS